MERSQKKQDQKKNKNDIKKGDVCPLSFQSFITTSW